MRAQMKSRMAPQTALQRLLEALERELIEVADDEVLEAAHALGMNPAMPWSAAFAGLKYFATPRPADFFARELGKPAQDPADGSGEKSS